MKNLVKRTIKKILIRLHLMESKVIQEQQRRHKEKPDFNLKSRVMPEYITEPGQIHESLNDRENPQIAIQVHAFFEEVFLEIIEILNRIPYPYDCYVSTDTERKKTRLGRMIGENCSPCKLIIDVMENRGRDVGPFLQQMAPVINRYKYIAHFHTKKSKHTDFGDDWRHYLYRNMFGSSETILAILDKFENDSKLGLVIPEIYPIVRELMAWDGSREGVQELLGQLGIEAELPEKPMCPVGDIFWARVDAVKLLFERGYQQSDFQEEAGQLNYTLAHVIERVWCYLVCGQGYEYKVMINTLEANTGLGKKLRRVLVYACTSHLSSCEIRALKEYKHIFDYIILGGSENCIKEYEDFADQCISVNETGSLNKIWSIMLERNHEELVLYDEVVLLSNYAYGPLFDIEGIMNHMSNRNYKEWTVLCNRLSNTMFTVFDVHQNSIGEIQEQLKKDAVIDTSYVKESAYIDEWLFTDDAVNELAFDFIVLHSPYISKRSRKYMGRNEKRLVRDFFSIQQMEECS